jgi:cytochrome c-type biogenesis protein CcmH
MPRGFAILVIALMLLIPASGHGVEPSEMLEDPKLEQRARDISQKLRCLVCQNQSIDDSNAPLAKDLRLLVRERLKAGDTNSEVIDYIVARYGEFGLLRPRFAPHTLLLWLGPPLLLLIAAFVMYRAYKRRKRESEGADDPSKKLSASEERRLKNLLEDG